MATQSLGERLKARIQHEEEDKLQKLERRAREKSEKEQKELAIVKEFFATAQRDITAAIEADERIPRIVVGDRQNMAVYSALYCYAWHNPECRITKTRHLYYPLWERFEKWATENGLKVDFRREHDGGGLESWHVLTVEPL